MGIFRTHRNAAALFCRIAIAAVFIPHGLDKLIAFEPLGWSGPGAWAQQVSQLLPYEFIPENVKLVLAQVAAWVELVAGVSCVLGLLVRLCIFPLLFDMIVAALLVHAPNGFWINHTINGTPAPGFEYNLFIVLICIGLMVSGAGSFSLDKLIASDADVEEEDIYYEEHPRPAA